MDNNLLFIQQLLLSPYNISNFENTEMGKIELTGKRNTRDIG